MPGVPFFDFGLGFARAEVAGGVAVDGVGARVFVVCGVVVVIVIVVGRGIVEVGRIRGGGGW